MKIAPMVALNACFMCLNISAYYRFYIGLYTYGYPVIVSLKAIYIDHIS